jgi:ATP-dependent DNA helicase RecG
MLNIYNQFNLKPSFAVTDNAFKVTLPNVNYKQEKKDIIIDVLNQKEKIIKYLEQYGKIKRETVDMLFNVSSARSKIILSEMIKENLIIKEGTGKNTYYVLK